MVEHPEPRDVDVPGEPDHPLTRAQLDSVFGMVANLLIEYGEIYLAPRK